MPASITPTRAILHADMDAFFASVEILDNPELRGKPVVVGGTPEGRGVVCAASYEARRYGIHSAMSAWQALRRCPHLVCIRPRFGRYSEVSARVFEIFGRYTPLVEGLSLDEAFMDVTGSRRLFGDAETIGRAIKRAVREELGLAVSVGVAPNKFLAKLASDLEKPDGFVVIRPEDVPALMARLPVEKLWGVGEVTAKLLHGLGVRKAGDVLAIPPEALEARLGSLGPHLLALARGIDERPVEPGDDRKSIGAENTFATDIADPTQLRTELDELVEKVARRMRALGLTAQTATLKARYPDFSTVTRAQTLPSPTALTRDLRAAARDLLEHKLGRSGRPLRLLGFAASRLEHADEGQAELQLDPEVPRQQELDRVLDNLHDTYGRPVLRRGLLASPPAGGQKKPPAGRGKRPPPKKTVDNRGPLD